MNVAKVIFGMQGEGRKAVSLLGLLCCIIMLASRLPVTAQGDAVSLPEPTGPYAVGRAIYEWVDEARTERYSDDPDALRELVVWVWYPADLMPDAQPDAYLPGALGQVVSQMFGADVSQVSTNVYADAPLAASDSPYPVLVFSHGNFSLLGTYTALLEEIASHGYVIAGIIHPYNAPITTFSDGRMIPFNQQSVEDESVAYWVEDTAFVVDQLTLLNGDDEQFADMLDLSRLGVFGHSIGGATAADFCLLDDRCQAGINLDGTLWGEAATEGVSQPFMQIFSVRPTCEEVMAMGGAPSLEECESLEETMVSGWQMVFDSAQAGYSLTIDGTTHDSFTDTHFLLPLLPSLDDGATIEPERSWRITADYVLAFFDTYLKGEAAPLLDAASPDYPEVTFARHEQ